MTKKVWQFLKWLGLAIVLVIACGAVMSEPIGIMNFLGLAVICSVAVIARARYLRRQATAATTAMPPVNAYEPPPGDSEASLKALQELFEQD